VFDRAILETAARERDIEFTTFGRKTGKPSRRIIWVTPVGDRVYIRSGLGMTRDWPKNLLANGRGVLHMAGQDVPVTAKHVTDPQVARSLHALTKTKYGVGPSELGYTPSVGNEPLAPSEQAVFELFPE
jgi:deazaflavin-dependent oxidoreductase (nitroreductase family)